MVSAADKLAEADLLEKNTVLWLISLVWLL
jgi:hypothetical protein